MFIKIGFTYLECPAVRSLYMKYHIRILPYPDRKWENTEKKHFLLGPPLTEC